MSDLSERALILAPFGRDADVATTVLANADITALECPSAERLVEEIRAGAGLAVVTSEALIGANTGSLQAWIADQPDWSDFPFVLLVHQGSGLERNPEAARLLERLGNVSFLERPFHPTTLISLARAALRGRRRQYEARARIEELRSLAGSLEQKVEERTAELRLGEARMRAIFQTNNQYQLLIDLDGTVLDANATALAGIEAGLEDVVGKPLWETPWFAHSPDLHSAVKAGVLRVAAGVSLQRELTIHLPIGPRSFDVGMRPMRGPQGDTLALIVEALDVTDRKRAEEALRQAQKLEAMGQLTGGVAHDFNNLLTPIVGGLDILSRSGLGTERQRRLIEGAMQSAERARALVQRLLAFARQQPLELRAIDIGTLVRGMAELVGSTIGPKISLVIEVPEGLPPARADHNQVEMALLNLCVNARDAMPEGGTLQISASERHLSPENDAGLSPGSYISLAVSDTGIGMDEETARRAVEPFFSTKGLGKGTGLGLSMAHGLARQLGGTLTITTAPDAGTRVEILLPVSTEAPQHEAPTVEGALPQEGIALLVDDDDLVRSSVSQMLSAIGYEVTEAKSAEDALELVKSGMNPSVVVTDHLMTGMSGAALGRALRARTPVLIVSGYAESSEITPDFPRLTKPFRQDELAAKLAEIRAAAGATGDAA
ncbi:response regulator [Sphingomonas koreensis]|jgi:PAS domain S-box-containing protein|uniref:PAS domain-containing sensor histidine kinase n=1 Tax=Sphingomonas koreensis TaxID=93064 RepID=UPI000F7F146D|nr:PAS domain-containing sensor histidine kinase [Sphingomonas koreensis]RSU72912.1 response regulator [Sphingomonas koreensis]RSX88940.1 response regulator [Sphingomonas koreensis]